MKSMLIILSFYLFGIALVPCSEGVPEEEQTECCTEHCSKLPEQSHEDDGCKVCNPFFSCACNSAGFIFSQSSVDMTQPAIVPVVKNTAYSPPFYLELAYSIFQPPKQSV